MDKFERGKRIETGVYDDVCGFTDEEMKLYWEMLSKDSIDTGINIVDDRLWIEGDYGAEMVVLSPCSLRDKATVEKYKKIIDELNSLGCTSFTITSEQIKLLLNKRGND